MKTASGAFSRRAHAKLNLRLEVGERVGDLHSLVSVIAPLELADELRFSPASDGFTVMCDGLAIPERTNLVWRAAHELGVPPPIAVALVKRIPLQAGLGGGSADAAETLLGVARFLNDGGRDISQSILHDAATRLGSDVPSALIPGLKIVAGVGEKVTPYPCTPPDWGISLLKPRVGSETARAYALLDATHSMGPIVEQAFENARAMCRAFASHDFSKFLGLLHNDFCAAIGQALPHVASARERLADVGAAGTIVCGSGSSVAGFFEDVDSARRAHERISLGEGEWSTVTRFQKSSHV